ncbi:autotransporter outer membrane beta-barrel domain-containing protein [Burkholderia cepacia]|nr:autotransporter domain-containing protein [Burkholderia cepacia]QOH36748.1 outer membrane autotransporter barrel domain protein [Burkholderia cepacia]
MSGEDGAANLSRSTGGVLAGVDGVVAGDVTLGVMTGYSHSSFHVDDRNSSASSDNLHLGVYGGKKWGPLALRSGLAYTWSHIQSDRSIAFPGFANSVTATYHANTVQAFTELGYAMSAGNFTLEPYANVSYVNVHTNGFSEAGGVAGLNVKSATNNLVFSTLGARASTDLVFGSTAAKVRGMVGWRHAYGNVKPSTTQSFVGSPDFSVSGVRVARDAAVVEAGIDFAVGTATTVGVTYEGQVGAKTNAHSVKGNLKYSF